MEKGKQFELNEEELDQVSGGTTAGIQKRNTGKSKVWCSTCGTYVGVSVAGSGARTKCSNGNHYVDEL